MKKYAILISMFIAFIYCANSQVINKWINLDTNDRNYTSNNRDQNIFCSDMDNLIVIDQEVSNTRPFIKISSDGGSSWEIILKTQAFGYEFNTAAYPSKNVIYVAGDSTVFLAEDDNFNFFFKSTGLILKSIDRGQNWEKIILDSNSMIKSLQMINDSTGIAYQQYVNNYFNRNVAIWDTLLFTTDGFKTYRKIPLPDSGTRLLNLKLFSENNILISWYNYNDKKYMYLETFDQGLTWQNVMQNQNVGSISFIDRLNAYSVKFREDTVNSNIYYSDIYKTVDGGESWEFCFTPASKKWTNYYASVLAAVDEDNVIICGSNGLLFKSKDGGKNWFREYPPNGNPDLEYDGFIDLVFADNNTAYAILSRRLLKMTSDTLLDRPILNQYSGKISPAGIKAEWTEINGALNYNFQLAYSVDNTYSYSKFDSLVIDTTISGNNLILPDMEYNSCYYGRVKAIGDAIESEWCVKASMFCTYTNPGQVPAPKFISPKSSQIIEGHSFQFVWTSIPDVNKYELMVCDNPFYQGNNLRKKTIENDTSVIIDDLPENMELYAKLRANDGTKISDWVYLSFTTQEPDNVNENVDENNNIIIYPNPSNSNIKVIRRHNLKRASIIISDLLGTQVYQNEFNLNDNELNIDISFLPAGLFRVVVISDNGNIQSTKIIKQ